MPANPWELRADVRPLEVAALRWSEIGALLARRGDEIVEAARRATDGWDAAAAESYDDHRRQVLAHLDRFTHLAEQISGSLRAIGAIITSSQKELDQAWTTVAMVPHDVVGELCHPVFRPAGDADRGKVTRSQAETEEIRRRLALSLDQESTRLRAARAELVMVRTELTTLACGTFPHGLSPGEEESGVGIVPPASTSVPASAQSAAVPSGVTGLPPIASVSMPDPTGPSAAGLVPLAATAASGPAARRTTNCVPPIGGPGAGGMGVRAGTTSRGIASGRSGPQRPTARKQQGTADVEAARTAREREATRRAEKDAERTALAEKRAERAARRAERESRKDEQADLDGEHDGALGSGDETDAGHAPPRR